MEAAGKLIVGHVGSLASVEGFPRRSWCFRGSANTLPLPPVSVAIAVRTARDNRQAFCKDRHLPLQFTASPQCRSGVILYNPSTTQLLADRAVTFVLGQNGLRPPLMVYRLLYILQTLFLCRDACAHNPEARDFLAPPLATRVVSGGACVHGQGEGLSGIESGLSLASSILLQASEEGD